MKKVLTLIFLCSIGCKEQARVIAVPEITPPVATQKPGLTWTSVKSQLINMNDQWLDVCSKVAETEHKQLCKDVHEIYAKGFEEIEGKLK